MSQVTAMSKDQKAIDILIEEYLYVVCDENFRTLCKICCARFTCDRMPSLNKCKDYVKNYIYKKAEEE